MNKNCYRIVFNKARGILMAVAETAIGSTKASGATPHGSDRNGASMWVTLRFAYFCVLATFNLVACNVPNAQAQVVADPTAPAAQRPTVGSAANGVPLVNIQTPSAAGVSRNTYKRFDVQRPGVILNNARTNAQTQLGGWIPGNANLAGGTARVILNEVNSSNPSLLRGYVEAAGSRAQVVIANPAGISCDGCGFINADRSTLTTGTPIITNGSLDGFRVEGGTITVSGGGFDDSRSDYTDLIARSIQVNAGIWAKQLQATVGANEIDVTNTRVRPIAATGAAPAFGIDVAALGGMYASKIALVGTEAGVGARNAGNIGASVGDVIVTTDGRLENAGHIASVGSTRVDIAGDLQNSGSVQAHGAIDLRTPHGIDNSGGLIRSGGKVAIDADSLINVNTQNADQGIEGQSLDIATRTIDNRVGAMRADTTLTVTSRDRVDNTQGLISSVQTVAIRDADLSRKKLAVINTGGTLIANQMLGVDSFSLTGDGDALSAGDLNVKLTSDYTHSGRLLANDNASLETAGTLINQSTLLGGTALDVKAATIDNQTGGEIVAGQVNLTVAAPNTLTNRGLIDGQDTLIEAATLNNLGHGRIYGDHVAIGATTIHNQAEGGIAPVIAARARLDIGAQTLNNGEGALIFSAADMAIGGDLDANKYATGKAAAINNTGAAIEALDDLTIDTAALTNKRSAFSTTRMLNTELPVGLELLAYDPALEFSWNIVETAPVNWRNYVRDLYIDHIDSIAGVNMDAGYRSQLIALIDAQPRSVYEDSINVWNLLINKVNTDRPAWIDAMVTQLSSQSFPLRSYDQRCRDDECDYITYVTRRRTDYKDVVTNAAPPATIRAGGGGSLVVGALTNLYSTIETGGDLVLVGDTLLNQGAELYLQSDILSTGYTRHWLRSPKSPFSNASSTSRVLQTVPAVISAGGALTGSFTGHIDNIAIRENSAPSSATGRTIAALNIGDIGQTATGPNNSLFSINTANTNAPLIETDSRFASYRTWLSSDYMLQQLSLNPAGLHQRLGDGFYEQQLIREQVGQLTGRRFLDGYANDETQYRALLDQGLLYAQRWDLVPGIALTSAQIAQLTSDMVWLVEKTVALADGTQKTTLVPQLYVRVRDGDVLSSGALIAANDLQLNIAGDMANSGTIAGRSVVSLSAENVHLLGGSIRADDLLEVSVARDLNITSSTNHIEMSEGRNRVTLDQVNSIAGLYVTNAEGILVASAARNIDLGGARVSNSGADGQTVLSAGRDLNLGTVAETSDGYASIGRNWSTAAGSTPVGSTIQATGDVTLLAGNDLNARAAYVNSEQGVLTAIAGNDVNVATGTAESHHEGFNKSKKKGAFSSKTRTTYTTRDGESNIGNTLSGDTVYVSADNDLNIHGSNVVSTRGTQLSASNNINIEAATDTDASTYLRKEKRSGMFSSGGIGVTVGSQKQSHDNRGASTTAISSTVGSVEGDVTIRAGGAYRQTGSDILAPRGDIDISAKRVDIVEARETSHYTQEHKFKQSGISVSITSPIISAVQAVEQIHQATKKIEDSRLKALTAGTIARPGYNAYSAIETGQGKTIDGNANQVAQYDDHGKLINRDANAADQVGGINISISLGSSKSRSKSEQTSNTAAGSRVDAGGDVNITATSDGDRSDLTVRGSAITAGDDIKLKADNAINLLAAKNTYEQHSTNKGSSASVGVGFALGGSQNGFTINAGVSAQRGNADGDDASHTNTHVSAGNTLTIESGGDTNLKGAVASGKQVVANVHGDLNIESLQDTSTYESEQKSGGVSASLCIPPFCYGASSASANYTQLDVEGDYASITQQSGITAGDEGFQVTVQGNTNLKGAVIASTDQAIEDGKNRLTTGTLTTSDIRNHADASASSSGFGISSDMLTQGKYGIAKAMANNALSNADASEESTGHTRAALSGGLIDITDEARQITLTGETGAETIAKLHRDVSGAHAAANKIDISALQDQVEAERFIKQEAVKVAAIFTDEAYRTAFVERASIYKVERDPDTGEVLADANGKPVMAELSTEEKLALRPEPGEKLNVFTNGIFNSRERAGGYAVQMSEVPPGKDVYLLYFPEAGNAFSELLVAGYQTFLEGSMGDLANATQEMKRILAAYGAKGLNVVGHSRGAMTIGNAMESLASEEGSVGVLANTDVKFVGPAYSAQDAANLLNQLSNGNRSSVQLQNHADDFVGSIIGGNPATYDQRLENSSLMAEWLRMFGDAPTVHSCYGTGDVSPGCRPSYGPPVTVDVHANPIQ